jgi:predicted phage tail protein
MNLFNIKQEYINLVNSIIDNNGELSPELSQALAINETELKEKAINYAYVIRSFEYENDIIDAEIKRLKALKEQKEKAIQKLKDTVLDAMNLYGIEKVDSPSLKLSFRKSESVEISENLDKRFMIEKITMQPDKLAIKEAIKKGEQVEGAVLVINQNLQIK